MSEEMPKKDSLDSMEGLPRQDIPLRFTEGAEQSIPVQGVEEKKETTKTKVRKPEEK